MPKIEVFTTPDCVQCKRTKRWLDEKGLEHSYIDVTEDTAAAERIAPLGYTRAPVVIVNDDKHWYGFRPDLLKELLEGSN